MKRAVCIAGGGAMGSYAVGIMDYYNSIGRTYDIYTGSSTGALISTMAASGNYNKLIEGYTSITHKDIFKISPVKIKKSNNGIHKYSFNLWYCLYNLIVKRKVALGDNTIFREKTIPNFFSEEEYNNIIESGKEVSISVSNLTLERSEMKNIKDFSYEDFCDWMWISTCAPLYMCVPEKDGYEYVDGAILNMVPVEEAILKGADEVDVIILAKEFPSSNIEKVRNIAHYIDKLITMLINKIRRSNLNLGALSHIAKKDVKINLHFTERKLTNNSLIFDKSQMEKWYREGFNYARKGIVKRYILMGDSNNYRLIEDNIDK